MIMMDEGIWGAYSAEVMNGCLIVFILGQRLVVDFVRSLAAKP